MGGAPAGLSSSKPKATFPRPTETLPTGLGGILLFQFMRLFGLYNYFLHVI